MVRVPSWFHWTVPYAANIALVEQAGKGFVFDNEDHIGLLVEHRDLRKDRQHRKDYAGNGTQNLLGLK
jgi:hypothetical protein